MGKDNKLKNPRKWNDNVMASFTLKIKEILLV